MIKLFSSENPFSVQQVKDLLDAHNIPCYIKNQFAQGAAGELAPLDCWPEVWLLDEEWLTQAQRLVGQLKTDSSGHHSWRCNQCHEENESSFNLCWNCQSQTPHI